MTEYVVISDDILADLITKVNKNLAEGYSCQGGLVFSEDYFYQAMVKVEVDSGEKG